MFNLDDILSDDLYWEIACVCLCVCDFVFGVHERLRVNFGSFSELRCPWRAMRDSLALLSFKLAEYFCLCN